MRCAGGEALPFSSGGSGGGGLEDLSFRKNKAAVVLGLSLGGMEVWYVFGDCGGHDGPGCLEFRASGEVCGGEIKESGCDMGGWPVAAPSSLLTPFMRREEEGERDANKGWWDRTLCKP